MATIQETTSSTTLIRRSRPKYSVVIPVYNEAGNLSPLHQELQPVMEGLQQPYEIIFVDDGSQDDSFPELQTLYEAYPQIRVIQFRRNFGQTAAFAAGFDRARGDIIITMDADGQNDPADIPRLLETMRNGDFDLVTGWRTNRQESVTRRLLSTIANRLISRSSQIVVHDRGCSLKVFDRDLVRHLRLYGQLHRFMPEIAGSVGARVAEVPVNDRSRRHGSSKYGAITRTPRVLLDMITVIFMLTYFSSPMRLFGSLGILTGGIGLLIGGGLAGAKIYNGLVGGWEAFHAYEIGNRPLLLLAILLIVVAVQFLMMGLLGEMVMRTYYEAQNKPPYYIRRELDQRFPEETSL